MWQFYNYSEGSTNITGILNDVKNHIEQDVRMKRINLLIASDNMFSITAELVMQSFIHSLPTFVISSGDFASPAKNEQSSKMKKVTKKKSENTLIVGILDLNKESNAGHELRNLIKFSMGAFAKTTRAKFLISLIYPENIYLRFFFEHAWTHKYLDITVVQFIEINVHDPFLMPRRSIGVVIRHTFNPFSKVYEKKSFKIGMELFPEKLQNLEGYPLSVGIINNWPLLYMRCCHNLSSNIWEMFQGSDFDFKRTLIEKMNFKANVKVAWDFPKRSVRII